LQEFFPQSNAGVIGIAQKGIFNYHTCFAACFQNFDEVL
jgi:hypothetical protein